MRSLYTIILHLMALGFIFWMIGWLKHFIAERYPSKLRKALMEDPHEGTELAQTTIYAPPSYGVRIVR